MATGDPWNRGFFVGGPEEWDGLNGTSARIQCLWRQENPELEGARAGYWQYDEKSRGLRSIPVDSGKSYVVSFNYCTRDVNGNGAALWLSYKPSPCWAGEKFLPPTGGEWRHVAFACGPAQEGDEGLRPLLRLWQPGTVLFDDFQIRQVEVRD